jgi:hypothetical protein
VNRKGRVKEERRRRRREKVRNERVDGGKM